MRKTGLGGLPLTSSKRGLGADSRPMGGRQVRPARSRPSGDDQNPPTVLQQGWDFLSFADQRSGSILAEFGPQARLRGEDTFVHRQLTPLPVLRLLAGL